MSEELTIGCVVFMKASSGLTGYGNAQCVSDVCEPLGTVSLYGHNKHYKIYDIDRVVEYPEHAELKTAEDDEKRLNWLDLHTAFVADGEYIIGPYKKGELRKMADDGIAIDKAEQSLK